MGVKLKSEEADPRGTSPTHSDAFIGLPPSIPNAAEGRAPRPLRSIGRHNQRIDRQGRHSRPLTERTGPIARDPRLIPLKGTWRRWGRIVIGMVMSTSFVVRTPHHMMKGHVLQLQRMNCSPNEEQAPSGKMTEP